MKGYINIRAYQLKREAVTSSAPTQEPITQYKNLRMDHPLKRMSSMPIVMETGNCPHF